MAEGVVDFLEQIQIDAANGEHLLLAPAQIDRGAEMVTEIGAIAQPGERVVMSEIGDFGLGPFARGNVDDRHQLAVVRVVGDLPAERKNLDFAAVGANVSATSIGLIGVAGRASRAVPLVRVADFIRRHLEEAIARIAVMRDRRVVHGQEAHGPGVDDPHRHGIGVEQQPVGLLSQLQGGDVRQRDANEIAHQSEADADMDGFAVRLRRELESFLAAVRLEQTIEMPTYALRAERVLSFAEAAPSQALGAQAEQFRRAGVEIDDLKIDRSPVLVADHGKRDHAFVAGVKDRVDQAVSLAAFSDIDRDEGRPPTVRQRKRENVVALHMAVPSEIGLGEMRSAGR